MIPLRLKMGDTIGIISPSTPVPRELESQFNKGISFLESLGFNTVIGEHIFSASWDYSASPQEKAKDIHRMFVDKTIKAIACSQGGVTANSCLSHLDWNILVENPKIFLGFSDISVLLNAIHHMTGLVTFHTNDVLWGFGRNPSEYDKKEFIHRFIDGDIGLVNPNGDRQTIRSGVAEGKLMGGNIKCLLKLAGTSYFPDLSGAILIIEGFGVKSENCDQMFHHLKHLGVFDRINGIIIGYIDGLQNTDKTLFQMEEVLLRITPEYNFPILKTNDFGHNCSNTVLPIGCRARIDAYEKTVEILEECVDYYIH